MLYGGHRNLINFSKRLLVYRGRKELEDIGKVLALQIDAWTSFTRGERLKNETYQGTLDLSDAIEAYQHCIELSIKSLYQFQVIQPPKVHDPTKEFEKVFDGLINRGRNTPEISKDIYYWIQMLARIRWISMVSAKFHELSMYAFSSVPARDFFYDKDVEYLSRVSREVYNTAVGLVEAIYNYEKTSEQYKNVIPIYQGLAWLEN